MSFLLLNPFWWHDFCTLLVLLLEAAFFSLSMRSLRCSSGLFWLIISCVEKISPPAVVQTLDLNILEKQAESTSFSVGPFCSALLCSHYIPMMRTDRKLDCGWAPAAGFICVIDLLKVQDACLLHKYFLRTHTSKFELAAKWKQCEAAGFHWCACWKLIRLMGC